MFDDAGETRVKHAEDGARRESPGIVIVKLEHLKTVQGVMLADAAAVFAAVYFIRLK